MPQFHPQAFAAGQQYAQQFAQHYAAQNQQPAAQTDQMRQFWAQQLQEIEQVPSDPAEFKNHQLPLARIKKVRGVFNSAAKAAVPLECCRSAAHAHMHAPLTCTDYEVR